MDTHFPYSVLDFSDGQCVVEVFGIARVDGEGGHVAHVDTFCHLLRSDSRIDDVRRPFHFLRIFVRQSKFSEDGVHLRVVFSAGSKHIDHLSHGIVRPFRPVGDFHESLLSVLSAFEFIEWDDDVVWQLSVRRNEESSMLADLQHPDIRFLIPFDDFHHLSLQFLAVAFLGKEADFHLVARQSVECVLVIDAHPHSVRQINKVFASSRSAEYSLTDLGMPVVGHLPLIVMSDFSIVHHLVENVDGQHFERV